MTIHRVPTTDRTEPEQLLHSFLYTTRHSHSQHITDTQTHLLVAPSRASSFNNIIIIVIANDRALQTQQ